MKVLIPLALAASLLTTATSAAVPAAEQAWRSGDYQKAFAQAIEAADDGDADAQFLIGEAYRLGKGTYENLYMADVWYFRAASRGHVRAAAQLGAICAAEHRLDDARHWLRFAANQGDVGAQGSLAAVLYNDPRDEQDTIEALTLMSRAAAAGSEQAKMQLARIRGGNDPVVSQAILSTPSEIATGPQSLGLPPSVAVPTSSSRNARVLSPSAPSESASKTSVVKAVLFSKPTPPTVADLPRRPASQAMWRVQVGAFRSSDAAQKAWVRLASQVSSLRKSTPFLSQTGTLVRVQTSAYSRADAVALCRNIHAVRWACFVRAKQPQGVAIALNLR